MTDETNPERAAGIAALFTRKTAPATVLLAAGIGLEALEFYIATSLAPSMVRDIGGLELLAWTASLFIVAIVLGSIAVVVRPLSINLNRTYIAGALLFALGCGIIGLAPDMRVVLVGRVVQGFGAGLLVTMGYSFIRFVYPPGLQNAASALYTSLWGVAVFLGPTLGGVFSAGSQWRWAFLLLIPPALAMALAAPRWLPKGEEDDRIAAAVPLPQIALILLSVLAISFAGTVEHRLFSALLVIFGMTAVAFLGVVEHRSAIRLLPTSSTRWSHPLSRVYLTMAMLIIVINSDIYIPYFLQTLHSTSPLVAGYLVALVALGWTTGGLGTASFADSRGRLSIVTGCLVMFMSTAGLTLAISHRSPAEDLIVLGVISGLLFGMGLGIGLGWAHLVSLVLTATDPQEADKASASINLVQSLAAALGSALAGVIANGAGLAMPGGVDGAITASRWLYALMALPALAAFLAFWPIFRRSK